MLLVGDYNLIAGISSIGAKIKGLNPHTWPGWFMLPYPTLLLVIIFFTFKDHTSTTSSDMLRSTTSHANSAQSQCGRFQVSSL